MLSFRAMALKSGCRSIIESSGGILLVQEGTRGPFGLPGGKIEGDETEVECVRRELHEETGLVINPIYALGLYQDVRTANGNNVIDTVFVSEIIGGELTTSRGHPAIDYFDYELIEKMATAGQLRSARMLIAIHDYRRGKRIEIPDLITVTRTPPNPNQ